MEVQTLRYTILLISILSYFFVEPSLCTTNTTNTIKPGQALNYSDKLLVSADRRFQLGFFNLTYSSKVFLGIRYARGLFNDDVIWVANRDTPIKGVNATLTMDAYGLLKIMPGGREDPIPINSNQTAPNSTATLENTGNLVVRDLSSKRVLWQSFDYPTDTLLPGMKLGANLTSGKRWILSSWLSESNPGTGAFTLEYNRDRRNSPVDMFVVRRRGHLFSTWGPSGPNWDYYVSHKNEIYFTIPAGRVINLSLRLQPDGRIAESEKDSMMVRLDDCNRGGAFPNDCAEQKAVCRSKKDVFVRRGGQFLHSVNASTSYEDSNSSIVVSDCFQRCASNCSCVGFGTLFSDETGCVFYSQGARFQLNDVFLGDFFLLNTKYKSESGRIGSGKKWWMWIMISSVVFVVLGF